MAKYKVIPGGVCAAKGFAASGVHAGFRANPNKLDLAIIKADVHPLLVRRLHISVRTKQMGLFGLFGKEKKEDQEALAATKTYRSNDAVSSGDQQGWRRF